MAFLRLVIDTSRYSNNVWVMDLATGDQTFLAGDPTGSDPGPVGAGLDYSPDGKKFVYNAYNDTGSISVMDSSTGHVLVDTGAVSYVKPAFSPDGTKIAYSYQPASPVDFDSQDIWVMDADGANAHDVTPSPREPFFTGAGVSRESGVTWQPIRVAAVPPSDGTSPSGGGSSSSGSTTPLASSTPPPGAAVDVAAPVLGPLSLSPAVFRAAVSGASIASRVGTRVSYELSESAMVRFRVARALGGRRVGGRCVRLTRSNRRAPRCVRYRLLRGSFSVRGVTGQNRFRFSGRLRGRKLTPGSYRLRGAATDAAGNRSAPKRVNFRIVRR